MVRVWQEKKCIRNINRLEYYDLEFGILPQANRKTLTGLSRGVMWSGLLFRSYSAAVWRLDWKSQGEAGSSKAMAAAK